MQELHRVRRKGADIPSMQSAMQSLRTRLKYEITDRDTARDRQIKQAHKDLKQFQTEIKSLEPKIAEIDERIGVSVWGSYRTNPALCCFVDAVHLFGYI